ncbi:MAG: hypothetical protein LBP61_09060 [Desulfovibrio sp.]|jgi:hypothetical protein|nr:hypothetical protein [Desulfovibrio sp.]
MLRNSQPVSIPWGVLFYALLGLAWCGYVAFPAGSDASGLCATSGCLLLRDLMVAGISPWWVGGVYFFLLAVFCLRGAWRLVWLLSRLALLLDAFLLLLMFFTGPCVNCLVAGIFFGLTAFAARPTPGGWFLETPPQPLLLAFWLGLFLGNVVLAFNESLPHLTLGNSARKEARLFFSPSCPACRDALAALGPDVALYPIREQEGDLEAILRLSVLLDAQTPMAEAVARCRDPGEPLPELSLLRGLWLRIQLLRNKSLILRQGVDSLPLIQINGLPGVVPAGEKAQSGGAQGGGEGLDFLRDLSQLNRCPQGAEKPCDP